MSQMKIWLADDHQIILDGITQLLKEYKDIKVDRTFNSGDELMKHLSLGLDKPTIIITDISMTGLNGIEMTRQIKLAHPEIKIIILSMHAEYGFLENVIESGADAYVLKDEGTETLMQAIQSVMDGHKWYSQTLTEKLINRIQISRDPSQIFLSQREKQVLKLLSEGLTSEKIGDQLAMSKHTVDTFRRNLLHKFDVKNVTELIKEAIFKGFLLS